MRRLALAAMLCCAAVGGPRAALAQGGESEARTALVLDFASNIAAAPMLGRDVSAAMGLLLTQRGYNVKPRRDVLDAMNRLGARAPWEADELRLLAKDQDVQLIFTGTVLTLDEDTTPGGLVKVNVRVEVFDGATGDMFNGAYGDGLEKVPGPSAVERDTGRAAAIDRALGKALQRINARVPITAAVLTYNPAGNFVLINRGLKQGVVKGMEFDVYRAKLDDADPLRTVSVKIGRVQCVNVSNDEAEAKVLEQTQGLNNRDQLREVFRLPGYTVKGGRFEVKPPEDSPGRGGTGAFNKLVAPVAAVAGGLGLLGLVYWMYTHSVKDAPSISASGGAYLRQTAPGMNPAIEVAWTDRGFAPPPNFIGGYLIYRGQSSAFSAVERDVIGGTAGSKQTTFADEPIWADQRLSIPVSFQQQNGTNMTTVNANVTVRVVHFPPTPGQSYYYKVRRLGPQRPTQPPELINRAAGTTAAPGPVDPEAWRRSRAAAMRQQASLAGRGRALVSGGNLTVSIDGLGLADPTRQVTSIPQPANWNQTLDPIQLNTVTLGQVGLSDATGAAGPITYMVPPDLLTPQSGNQSQAVNDIPFSFQGVLGASEYALQIGRDRQFVDKVFEGKLVTTASTVLSYRYDESKPNYQSLAPNNTYFWRVGARVTGQHVPMPDGWVFSQVFTFTTADQPPGPTGVRRLR
jgi:hypothetical protein